MLQNISRKRKILFIFSLLALITVVILAISIFFINITENKSDKLNKDTAEIVKVIKSKESQKVIDRPESQRLYNYLNSLSTAKSPKDKYDALTNTTASLQLLYSLTNEPELFILINEDLNNFASKNFPDFYNKSDFEYPCQDPSCAKNPEQPPEVLLITEEINNSGMTAEEKFIFTNNILNANYLEDEKSKVFTYMIAIRNLENTPDASNNKTYSKFALRLRDYVGKAYPEIYKDFLELEQMDNSK